MDANKILKNTATPLTIVTSAVVIPTGLFMHFIFKNKPIEEVHAHIGIIFAVATILHLIVNAKQLINHFKKKTLYYLLIPVAIIGGIQFIPEDGPPKINTKLVVSQLEKANIRLVSELFNQSPESVLAQLQANGYKISDIDQSIEGFAKENEIDPKVVLSEIMKKKTP